MTKRMAMAKFPDAVASNKPRNLMLSEDCMGRPFTKIKVMACCLLCTVPGNG
ncbi:MULTISPECIES: hypothetical protein [unclassified Rhizobium]|uniref:hypothetical protein n=1 Tax=unclassified Rhizobium TaxID=2613769 RepID=UPI0013AF4366|nr:MULTISPECIES: hypothetical protein [unclassified Rhizobium]MBB3289161.1 hypothetical protein [Rhizobium sp. BK252]MBB3403903.1 hypothetical protein [Rhizobium sp. BK289]MBB3416428.1 hypothetical protein [Rhizobium sp. BK284]MBB3484366.1 hypothetical protein [Rhizobium sp. BK347]MDK4718018.1 hypothetical protein [Rhizobium sp. CNPSo 3968]